MSNTKTKKSRVLEKYRKEVMPAMQKEFGYKNIFAIPKIVKVVVNVGVGRVAKEPKMLEKIAADLAVITGQKPTLRKAKKSISGFKLREGTPAGYMVTLRGGRMYDFIDRLISVALPRTRDFHGLNKKSSDQNGNLTIGIKEHNIFPEVKYESLKDIFGLEVTIVSSAKSHNEGLSLFKLFGFPIKV